MNPADKKRKKKSPPTTYPGVYIEEVPSGVRTITPVPTSITAFVGRADKGPMDRPEALTTFRDYERVFGELHNDCPMSFAVSDYFRNGGGEAIIVRVADSPERDESHDDLERLIIGDATAATGLYALEKAGIFNMLCIPPASESHDVGKDVIAAAAAYCEKRRAMLIVDSPRDWTTAEKAAAGMGDPRKSLGTNSANAAVFFPRILKPNPLREDRIAPFASCGAVAGVLARIDAKRGVWKAPAGADAALGGVSGLSLELTDAENGTLNKLACNCLRDIAPNGPVIWGTRTLRGGDEVWSEWKYIPVRRLALFIEESIYKSTQWVAFEPNDEPLWAHIRTNVDAFMMNLFRQGAFQGSKPGDAYFVKCDNETTDQNDIGRGMVNFTVGFAPLKPAEFVILHFAQRAG